MQVRDRDLYEACDTEVKRQIWKDSQALFGDEVSPLLTGYITSKEDTLFSVDNLHNLFFSPSPKVKVQLNLYELDCVIVYGVTWNN